MRVLSVFLFLASTVCVSSTLLQSGTPASANWSSLIAGSASSPEIQAIYQELANVGAPSAAIAFQSNTNKSIVNLSPPTTWAPGQSWWAVGWGTSYQTTMRVASNTKPFTRAIYEQHANAYLSSSFYTLWNNHAATLGLTLPVPVDSRVYAITIQELLDHTSGFDNSHIGYDPMFTGQTVNQLLPTILNMTLASTPGTTFSYSNFGYAILGTMVPALVGVSYGSAMKNLFPSPSTIPVYLANDVTQQPGEIGTYWAVPPDGLFSVNPMVGNGDLVTNVITLSWFANQYWIGGPNAGKTFAQAPSCVGCSWVWEFDGSMPGTSSCSVQFVNSKQQVSAAAVIVPFRPTNNAAGNAFLANMNQALLNLLQAYFS